MTIDSAALYSALTAHDARFDGVFYVGVTSTGIYCRPVCTARTPRAENCRFFNSAAAAEKAKFRPCLRCRPELAPGNAPVDDAHRIAGLIAHRIDEGGLDARAGVEEIARQFGWSSRQIRRMLQKALGVSPMELVMTRRLLLAKQLLTETSLPIAEIAHASGFASLRRFNDAFGKRYGMPPSRFRKAITSGSALAARPSTLTLQLGYRAPFDWDGILAFLGARALSGVECVRENAYGRTVRLGAHEGWIRVRDAPERRALLVELTQSLTPVLPALLVRLRNLFDLSARPDVVGTHLARDPLLAAAVARNPGLRVPGAFDGFELAVRAILGQQITVRGATTLGGRFASAFGDPAESVDAAAIGLSRFTPTADVVAQATADDIASLGITQSCARSIIAFARAMASGELALDAGVGPTHTIEQLLALPGIGDWTAQYIAMRALRWPDAFPAGDIALRKQLGGVTAAGATERSRPWSPWRSYATLYVWRGNS